MSETTEGPTDKKREAPAGGVEKQEAARAVNDRASGSGGVGSVLAILLALVAIGVASYPAYEIYRQQSIPVIENIAEQPWREEVSHLRAPITDLEAGLASLAEQVAAKEAVDLDGRQQMAAALEDLGNRIGTSSHDWVYAEIEYLIRMANQRVLMEQDPTSALQLLQSADDIIRETDGLAAHDLRAAIQNDMASLKAAGSVDIQGIYLALSALVKQVPQLPRSLPEFEPAPAPSAQANPPAGFVERMKNAVSRAVSQLAGLVDFRRGTVEIKPILPPGEEYYLRQNLILKLRIAQMALLDGNDAIYQDALADARQWVAASFDQDAAATEAMRSSLEQLAGERISIELPDISGSLNAARKKLSGFKEAGPK